PQARTSRETRASALASLRGVDVLTDDLLFLSPLSARARKERLNPMSKRTRWTTSVARQMRQSMAELQSIMERRQSPLGGGRFTVRTIEVAEPSRHNGASVRAIRKSLNVSQ